ncbi:MAG: hypothetical protein HY746_09565 [Elusimicrobia bacterium]|nr:hypothetical protein [Elusimicrobiota bacterium]
MGYSSGTVLSGYLSQIPSVSLTPFLSDMAADKAVFSYGSLWGAKPEDTVKLIFSNELSTSIVSSEIKVTEVFDNMGSVVNSSRSVNTAYDPSGKFLSIDLSGSDWPKGSLFAVYYTSDSMKDINGLPVAGPATAYFTVIFDRNLENKALVIEDWTTNVRIPANTYNEDFFMPVSTSQDSASVQTANRKMESLPGIIAKPVKVINAASFDSQGNSVQPIAKPLISLPYKDDDNNGMVDGINPPARARNLSIWHLDEAKSMWVKQIGAVVDTGSRMVSLNVSHFSSYGLMALPDTDVSAVYVYPVPFRPNAGNPARYGTWTDMITFTNLPSYGTIRIYTIRLELVREINISSPPEMKWDVKNSAGEIVASGVYIWEVVVESNRKTGKLMVIK